MATVINDAITMTPLVEDMEVGETTQNLQIAVVPGKLPNTTVTHQDIDWVLVGSPSAATYNYNKTTGVLRITAHTPGLLKLLAVIPKGKTQTP
jgi:hypothetical protein